MALVKPGEKNFFQTNKRRLPPVESIGIKKRVLGIFRVKWFRLVKPEFFLLAHIRRKFDIHLK